MWWHPNPNRVNEETHSRGEKKDSCRKKGPHTCVKKKKTQNIQPLSDNKFCLLAVSSSTCCKRENEKKRIHKKSKKQSTSGIGSKMTDAQEKHSKLPILRCRHRPMEFCSVQKTADQSKRDNYRCTLETRIFIKSICYHVFWRGKFFWFIFILFLF